MAVWVQLAKSMQMQVKGVYKTFHPGDWVQVGKNMAQQMMLDGTAVSPYPTALQVEEPEGTAGIMMFGRGDPPSVGVEVSRDSQVELRWEKTCLWWNVAPIKHTALFAVGFALLDKWQMAVPLHDYRVLACDDPDSNDDEKEMTRSIIRDLRVPMYDTRMMFVKRCEATRALFSLWDNENMTRLGFLRALYRTKPLICALPASWTGQWVPTEA